jgi:hypothetical protein
MPKIDLRLLPNQLIANTNEPKPDEVKPASPPVVAKPRREPMPRLAPPVRPHRALRPRRRS